MTDKPKLGPRATWEQTMLAMAVAAAKRSKDDTTRVGAVICSAGWDVLGTGFNGFPRGAPDSTLPTGGPGRHLWTIHAEINALMRAIAAAGFPLPEGSIAICTHRLCAGCCKMLWHAGVRSAIYDLDELSPTQAAEAEAVAGVLGLRVESIEEHELMIYIKKVDEAQ